MIVKGRTAIFGICQLLIANRQGMTNWQVAKELEKIGRFIEEGSAASMLSIMKRKGMLRTEFRECCNCGSSRAHYFITSEGRAYVESNW